MSEMKHRNYFGFDGWGPKHVPGTVAGQFEADLGPEPGLVYAVYSTPSYEGAATVIFKIGNQWFDAGGSHCSCYGLEEQWAPSLIDPADHLEALKDGRKLLLVADTDGDYPEATQENFDAWLQWATSTAEAS